VRSLSRNSEGNSGVVKIMKLYQPHIQNFFYYYHRSLGAPNRQCPLGAAGWVFGDENFVPRKPERLMAVRGGLKEAAQI